MKLSYGVPLALDDLVDDLVRRKKAPPVILRGSQLNYDKPTAHIPSKCHLFL